MFKLLLCCAAAVLLLCCCCAVLVQCLSCCCAGTVFELLLRVSESGDWPAALAAAVPGNTGYQLKPEYRDSAAVPVSSGTTEGQAAVACGVEALAVCGETLTLPSCSDASSSSTEPSSAPSVADGALRDHYLESGAVTAK